jgi:integrin alpha FG-GAP repeat containing protein 1
MALLFDLDENGVLDIMLVHYNEKNKRNELHSIVNTYHKEAFFIKSKVINSQERSETLYLGSSVRAVVTELDDEKYIAVGQQVTENSYGVLSLPYSYIGIGRSNNYIE